MRSKTRSTGAVAVLALALVTPALAAEPEPIGVVTAVGGTATVRRLPDQTPRQLEFKSDVRVKDRIETAEDSFARLLLGGKAVVNVRERSAITITDVPGAAVVAVGNGRMAMAVAKEKMRPGDSVEIRTPNATAAIRGTVVVTEVVPGSDGGRSTITVLKGLVDVTPRDPATGRAIGPPVSLGALERLTVIGGNVPAPPQAITPAQAERVAREFRTVPKTMPPASVDALNRAEVERAVKEMSTLLPPNDASARNAWKADVGGGSGRGTSDRDSDAGGSGPGNPGRGNPGSGNAGSGSAGFGNTGSGGAGLGSAGRGNTGPLSTGPGNSGSKGFPVEFRGGGAISNLPMSVPGNSGGTASNGNLGNLNPGQLKKELDNRGHGNANSR